jgi:outer membrane autotransporter protein
MAAALGPALACVAAPAALSQTLVTGTGFAGQSGDEIAVAAALNAASPGATGDFASVLSEAALTPNQPKMLGSLGGQIYGNLAEVGFEDRRLFLDAMQQHMWLRSAAPSPDMNAGVPQIGPIPPSRPALWILGFGQFGGIGNGGGALGVNYSTGGAAAGVDLIRTPETVLGIAVSGGQTGASLRPEFATVSFAQFGAYGSRVLGTGAVLDGALIYAHDFDDVARNIVLTSLSRTATSHPGDDDILLDAGISRPFEVAALRITPRAGLSYFHADASSFSESGAGSLDLNVEPNAFDALRSRVEIAAARALPFDIPSAVIELRAAWTHDFLDDRGAFAATFAGAPTVGFTQIGAAPGRDTANLGGALSVVIAENSAVGRLTGFVRYNVSFSAHQVIHAGAAGLTLVW